MRIQRLSRQLCSGCKHFISHHRKAVSHIICPRSKAMMTVPTVTPTGLVPLDGPTFPWMTMTGDSLPLVDTAPGITIVRGHPSPSAGTIMTVMAMDVVHHLVLALRTTHPRAVPMRTPMMPGPLPLHATMMIPI